MVERRLPKPDVEGSNPFGRLFLNSVTSYATTVWAEHHKLAISQAAWRTKDVTYGLVGAVLLPYPQRVAGVFEFKQASSFFWAGIGLVQHQHQPVIECPEDHCVAAIGVK